MTEYVTLILTTKKGETELQVEKNIRKLNLSDRNLTKISDLTGLYSLRKLRCSNNELTAPPALPSSLTKLYCHDNKLASLPTLPSSLRELYCSNNELTALPTLPSSLTKLYCHENKLASLPALPSSLLQLRCNNNQLASLPALPSSLRQLNCWKNQLIALPTLPSSLQQLDCSFNQLTALPTLPSSLQQFDCWNNRLMALPMSLLQCRQLEYIIYSNNPIEYIPPALRRFLDQQTSFNNQTVYADTQNVHASSIQTGIRQSIYQLIEVKPTLTADQCLTSLLSDEVVTTKTKELLVDYLNQPDTHSVLGITFQELFTSVWSVIVAHPDSVEIKHILNQEIQDSECKCFTGRMSRLINCLNGFDERVQIQISKTEQINALILMLMKKYEGEGLKSHFRVEMIERGYTDDIEEWLGHL